MVPFKSGSDTELETFLVFYNLQQFLSHMSVMSKATRKKNHNFKYKFEGMIIIC